MGFGALVKKDVRLLLADRRSLLVNLAVPVVLASFVGYLFAPRDEPASRIDVAVVDLDGSAGSRRLADALRGEEALRIVDLAEAEARRRIEVGDLTAAVVLPEGLGASLGLTALFTDRKPTVALMVDPSRANEARVVEGLLVKVAMQQVGAAFADKQSGTRQFEIARASAGEMSGTDLERRRWRAFFDSGIEALAAMPDEPAGEGAGATGGLTMPVEVTRESVVRGGGAFNSYAHSFAGMIVMYLLFVATDGGVAVIEERRRGTWRRLRTAPVPDALLLLSKVATTFLQGLLVILVVYAFGWLVFGVEVLGSPAGFAGVLLLSALVAASFALLLMGLGRTRGQVMGFGVFGVLVMSFLGGAWFPVWLMPEWLRSASRAVPTRWMMDGLHATTWRGLGIEAAAVPMLALAGFCLLFGLVGLKAFRWDD